MSEEDRERARVEALRAYGILDTAPDPGFDALTTLAAQVCGTQVALVSLVDDDRQWFKSRHRFAAEETPRDVSFCAVAIRKPDELLVVEDAAADERFRDNPLVTAPPHIRFYAGAPLVDRNGFALGSLCVIDFVPKRLPGAQREQLRLIARQVVALLELHRANLELRRDAGVRDRLTAVLGHDLRNPLFAIEAGAQTLLRRGRLEGDDVVAAQRIERSARRMRALVSEVLDWLQTNRLGKIPLSPRQGDLGEAAAEAVAEMRLARPARTFSLRIVGNTQGVWDVDRLCRALSNLLTNADRYGDPAAPVDVEVDGVDGAVRLRVRNAGAPIPAERQAALFEPFVRGDGVAGGEGLGLGLFIVREVVRAHGGRVEVRSSPGDGTTFTLVVPRAPGS